MIPDLLVLRLLTAATPKPVIAGAPGSPGLDETIERSGRGATAI